jgi:hypothetical protein
MAGVGICAGVAGNSGRLRPHWRSAGTLGMGLALTALRSSGLRMMTTFPGNRSTTWMLPRHSAASSRLRGQVVKGGTQVRGANENYRTAYLMCVLYAFVVIVLAAVFLL